MLILLDVSLRASVNLLSIWKLGLCLFHRSGAPAPVEKTFPRREEQAIGKESDNDDDGHDGDHLIHSKELAAVLEQLPETESGEDRDEDFSGHQGAPGKGPALFHSADEVWQ